MPPQLERQPYFRCYPADYLLDTRHLTMAQDGAYWLLMANYYWDGLLPPKPALYRLCKAGSASERADVDIVLDQFFQLGENGYTHNRIEREREKLGAMVRGKRKAGAASAEKRWSGHEKKTPARKSSKGAANGKHPISDDWLPSSALCERLGAEFKISQAELQKYFDHFVSACRAKDYRYKDFDAAFSNSVRADWPRLREGGKPAKPDPFNPGPGKAVM